MVQISFFSRLRTTLKLRGMYMNGYTVLYKPIAFSNGFLNLTNYIIKWENWTEKSSSSLEKYYE